jgi:acetate---CoA ligase (ADP-forming)
MRASHTQPTPVERLLRPRSIAIAGSFTDPFSIGNTILGYLDQHRYGGAVHPVSRSRSEVNGHRCIPSLDELPEGIDLAVLIVPETAATEAMAACVRRKAGAAVVFASGFAETGAEGRARQNQLATIAREAGLAVLGPNCVGFINSLDRIGVTFNDLHEFTDFTGPGVGMIAQSGAMSGNISSALAARGLPLTYVISSGNEAVTGLEDFLEFLLDDERTGSIALFIEQIRNPQRFLALAARARALGKPIVMMHPGRTARGRESSQSHTGALASDYTVMRTLVEREAVVVVDTLDELFDVTALLARWRDPPVLGVGMVTNSGAFRTVALDFCEQAGLDIPALTPESTATLKAMLPAFATVGNPCDMTTLGRTQLDIAGRVAKVIVDDPNIGSVLVSLIAGPPKLQIAKAQSLLPLMKASKKPIIFTLVGDSSPLDAEFTSMVEQSGEPFFRSPDRAMRAIARMTAYGQLLRSTRNRLPASRPAAIPLPGSGTISEYLGKRYLAAFGVCVPDGELASNMQEAEQIAARIGYPVVIKAQSGALAHKSDAGGVITGIANTSALRAAWKRLHGNLERTRPGLALDGILVESMAAQGLEMIVGARRDPQWGPVVMVGLGGIWTEALADVRILPADLDENGIVAELRKLKGARLLAGMRGQPPRDVRSVAKTAAILGGLMRTVPELAEIDINPLVVYADGKGVQALDALLVVKEGER